jgi:hypothetical protein
MMIAIGIGLHNFGEGLVITKLINDPNISNSRLDFIRDANVTKENTRTDIMDDYLVVLYKLVTQNDMPLRVTYLII